MCGGGVHLGVGVGQKCFWRSTGGGKGARVGNK